MVMFLTPVCLAPLLYAVRRLYDSGTALRRHSDGTIILENFLFNSVASWDLSNTFRMLVGEMLKDMPNFLSDRKSVG